MIPEYLALRGFVGYARRTELDFSGRDTIGIVGPNQAGKSTLLHAISYALYGRTLAKCDDHLLNDFCDEMVVELRIKIPGDRTLEITRGRDRRGKLICEVSGFNARKPAEVAQHIQDTISLAYDDFIGLQYFRQGDIHQFMEGDKRAYFSRWTSGLSYWQELEQAARDLERETQRDLDKLQARLDALDETIARGDAIKDAAKKTKREASSAEDKARLLYDAVHQLQDQLVRSESQETVKEALDGLRSQVRALDRQIERDEQALVDLRKSTTNQLKGVCPLLHLECDELAEANTKQRKQLRKAIKDQNKSLNGLKADRQELVARGRSLKRQIVDSPIPQIQADLVRAQRDLNEANRQFRRASQLEGEAKKALHALQAAVSTGHAFGKEILACKAKLQRTQFLRYMCGKNGIPAKIIERQLSKVEAACNEIFRRLDHPKQIKFRGYHEMRDFEKICPVCGGTAWHAQRCRGCNANRPRRRKESPTVTILEGGLERPFSLESGAAKVITSFAVRLSAGLFVGAMTGTPLDAIFLDEVFSHLDQSNRTKIMAMLIGKLKSQFGIQRQIVVSHADDITHTIDHLIVVRKEQGSSVAGWA